MTLKVPNDILNDTPADAVPVDANYKKIEQYINTNLVNRDGTVAMQGQLSLVGDPVKANDAARKAYVDAILPVGIMLPWLGTTAPAGEWHLADGASLSTTAYPDLFSKLQYAYGGSGGTFKLPNMAAVVPIGYKANDARYGRVGGYGGSSKVPVPSHVHDIEHDHGEFNSALSTALHQHPMPHNHPSQVSGEDGAHDHALRYESYTIPQGSGPYLARRWVDTSGTQAVDGTDTSPTHTHTVDIANYTGNTQSNNAQHDHKVNVPKFIGNSKAYVLEITDANSDKSSTDFFAPFVTINYIVRIK